MSKHVAKAEQISLRGNAVVPVTLRAAVRALRIKADKVRALLESILIINYYSVLNNLLSQKCRAAFELDDIDRSRQNLQQMTHTSE